MYEKIVLKGRKGNTSAMIGSFVITVLAVVLIPITNALANGYTVNASDQNEAQSKTLLKLGATVLLALIAVASALSGVVQAFKGTGNGR